MRHTYDTYVASLLVARHITCSNKKLLVVPGSTTSTKALDVCGFVDASFGSQELWPRDGVQSVQGG